jgi:polysaccharide export outer membrane protein
MRIAGTWMFGFLAGLAIAVAPGSALLSLQAQDAPQTPDASQGQQDPKLKPNPLEVLRNFEPAEDEEYRLGKGDEIAVDFAGRPELSAKLVIGPDGRITLPLAGDIVLAGLTRSQAAAAIEAALTPYYANLAAQVAVTKYTANKVLLLGAVEKPGVITFDGTPTLLEALTRGGMNTSKDKPSQIPERCAIYRGHDQVVWVDLRALLNSGNALADLRLRRRVALLARLEPSRIFRSSIQHRAARAPYRSTTYSIPSSRLKLQCDRARSFLFRSPGFIARPMFLNGSIRPSPLEASRC